MRNLIKKIALALVSIFFFASLFYGYMNQRNKDMDNIIHIPFSYDIWKPSEMKYFIDKEAQRCFKSDNPEEILNRSYFSMYVEWWLHNIGYYATYPLCDDFNYFFKLNERFRDVDLEEWKRSVD